MSASTFSELLGVLGTLLKTLSQETVNICGSTDPLKFLGRGRVRPAIRELAKTLVKNYPPTFSLMINRSSKSHREIIQAASYDIVMSKKADDELDRLPVHNVDKEVKLKRVRRGQTIAQVYHADFSAMHVCDLNDLEAFGELYPELQTMFFIYVVWKDLDDQFWIGMLFSRQDKRVLRITLEPGNAIFDGEYTRILVSADPRFA